MWTDIDYMDAVSVGIEMGMREEGEREMGGGQLVLYM